MEGSIIRIRMCDFKDYIGSIIFGIFTWKFNQPLRYGMSRDGKVR